jgi:hypothetical protein
MQIAKWYLLLAAYRRRGTNPEKMRQNCAGVVHFNPGAETKTP